MFQEAVYLRSVIVLLGLGAPPRRRRMVKRAPRLKRNMAISVLLATSFKRFPKEGLWKAVEIDVSSEYFTASLIAIAIAQVKASG